MFFLLVTVSLSLFDFQGENYPSGTIIEKYVSGTNGTLSMDISLESCVGVCQVEVVVFREVFRAYIFDREDHFRAKCGKEKLLKLNPDTPYVRHIFTNTGKVSTKSDLKTDGVSHAEFKMEPNTVYSVIFANCGPAEIPVEGYIKLNSPFGKLDQRVYTICFMYTCIAIVLVSFLVIWGIMLFRKIPKLAFQHQFIVATVALMVLESISTVMFFRSWNKDGEPSPVLFLTIVVIRGFTQASLVYFIFSGLQLPIDVPFPLFVVITLLFVYASYNEMDGIVDFSSRPYGRWAFGFGSTPMVSFAIYTLVGMCIIIYSGRIQPNENSDREKRKSLFIYYTLSFAMYFIFSCLLGLIRINMTLEQTKNFEWVPAVIQPVYFVLLTFVNGWFWIQYNPNGWESIDVEGENDLGIEDVDALVGTGMKKKKRRHQKPVYVIEDSQP